MTWSSTSTAFLSWTMKCVNCIGAGFIGVILFLLPFILMFLHIHCHYKAYFGIAFSSLNGDYGFLCATKATEWVLLVSWKNPACSDLILHCLHWHYINIIFTLNVYGFIQVVLADVLIENVGIVSEMNGLLQNLYWIIICKWLWSNCYEILLKRCFGHLLLINSLCVAVTILFMSLKFITYLWYAAWHWMNADSLATVM